MMCLSINASLLVGVWVVSCGLIASQVIVLHNQQVNLTESW